MKRSIMILLFLASMLSQAETILTIQGSNTVGADLAPEIATSFLSSLGAVRIEKVAQAAENEVMITGYFSNQSSKSIAIHAHGSSTGFAGLVAQTADIAMSSRPIKHSENLKLMNRWGDMTRAENEHVIALDGLAIVTHPNNPVKNLTLDQLAAIFSGSINNWQQVGGVPAPITLYARDKKSGTFDTFNALVLKAKKKALSAQARRFESNRELVAMVERDPNGIGFTGLAYAPDALLVKVAADEGLPEIKPATFSVASEDYPLTRRLYMYANAEKSPNNNVADFIQHAKGEGSQQIITEVGFVAQNISSGQHVVGQTAPLEYQRLAQQANRLSTTFRMRSERAEIDTKSQQDIERLVAYFNQTKPKTITLVGFSSNESDDLRNEKRAYIRSKMLAYQLRQHGFRNVKIISLGSQLPIDSNQTAQGKYKNNRTEIWVSQS